MEEEEAMKRGCGEGGRVEGEGGHTQRNAQTVTAPSGSLELRRMR